MAINTHTVKYPATFKETISYTNGFYFSNSYILVQEKSDGSKLRYSDYDGVFTYQPNEFSHERAMTPDEAEKFVTDFKALTRLGGKQIALNMTKQLDTLKEHKISYPQIRSDSIAIELFPKPIKIYFKEDKIIITELTVNEPGELATNERNKGIIIYRWLKIKNKIVMKNLKKDIITYVRTLKSNLKPTDKNYVLLTNVLDRLFAKYMELYG